MDTKSDTGRPGPGTENRPPGKRLSFGRYHMRLPASRLGRVIVGCALIIGGIFGFLPVLGFWMVPLGLLVLSVDLPGVRRWRRSATVRMGRIIGRKTSRPESRPE